MVVVSYHPWEDEYVRAAMAAYAAGDKNAYRDCAELLKRNHKSVQGRAWLLRRNDRDGTTPLPPTPPKPEPRILIAMPVRLDPVQPPREILKPKVPYRSDIPALSKALLMGGRAPRRQRCAA